MDLSGILIYILVGFTAQMIDGALGMAYGVSSTTFLLGLGVSPVVASASVHTAEIFTTAVSGLSHLKVGNVDKDLFKRLVIPGVIGGAVGAYVLTAVPGDAATPFIAAYQAIMGVVILVRAVRYLARERKVGALAIPLGVVGGLFDAIGGGGWGPIVTSTLVARGGSPRHVIGSVNLAEFFVTTAEVVLFLTFAGLTHWQVIVGLLLGGVLAAPLAAIVCKKVPPRALMFVVGLLIFGLSIRTIILALP